MPCALDFFASPAPKSCEPTPFPWFSPELFTLSTDLSTGVESLFVGAMKIARNVAVFGRWGEWHAPLPAPSLRELARPTGVTEGVSFDGCLGPMVYPQAVIGSEIFERLRSSKYTPSVSHSLDSSLREGAGNGLCHSSGCSLKSGVAGDFHRPYERRFPFNVPLGNRDVAGDFHRPYERVRSIGEKIRWGMGNGCFLTQFGVFSHAYTFSVR